MEGRAHCALLTATHFQKAVVRRSLIHLTSFISSCRMRCWKGKKRLQAALLRLHIKTYASTRYRAADRCNKHTCERWKKQLLTGEEELSSWLCSARVCAIRKKTKTQTVSGSCLCTLGPGFTSTALHQVTGRIYLPFSSGNYEYSTRQAVVPQTTMTCTLKEPILPNAQAPKDEMHFISVQNPTPFSF